MANNTHHVSKTLDAFLAGDSTLPQAYLFIGNSEAKSIAEQFAEKVLGDKFPNVDSIKFDSVEQGSIEAIREVLKISALMPVKSARKVVFMENMDRASTQMMNSLLKTLEEPPKHGLFILISSRPLLPTIMSRCQVFSISGDESAQEVSAELAEAISLLEQTASSGIAERMAIIPKLAELEDEVLQETIQKWMNTQVQKLNANPKNFKAVRCTMETLQSLKGNFNKKMVLQNFVLTGLK